MMWHICLVRLLVTQRNVVRYVHRRTHEHTCVHVYDQCGMNVWGTFWGFEVLIVALGDAQAFLGMTAYTLVLSMHILAAQSDVRAYVHTCNQYRHAHFRRIQATYDVNHTQSPQHKAWDPAYRLWPSRPCMHFQDQATHTRGSTCCCSSSLRIAD
jgi:hypothetical protein